MKITAIKQQEKRKDRYSIFVDGKYAFSLGEQALLDARLASGQEIDKEQLKAYKQLSADDKAYGNALRYAVMRPRSTWELRDYLRRKQVEEPVAEKIITRLMSLHLLDDEAFARIWVENRRLLKPTSRRKLSAELQQKHVASDIIDRVLAEDREQTDERQVLRDLIARKKARYPDQQKLMQYLARQGYAYDDIKSVLEESSGD
jgi:regulatory protein